MTIKTCVSCNKAKHLETEFHKNGKSYRGSCRVCYNEKKKNPSLRAARKAPEYYSFSLDVRRTNYHNVIDRMTHYGIMSAEYAEDAKERVDNLEEATRVDA